MDQDFDISGFHCISHGIDDVQRKIFLLYIPVKFSKSDVTGQCLVFWIEILKGKSN